MALDKFLKNCPIYQIFCADKQKQKEFLNNLVMELDRRNLSWQLLVDVKEEKFHVVLQALRQNDIVLLADCEPYPVKKIHVGNRVCNTTGTLYALVPEQLKCSKFMGRLLDSLSEAIAYTPVWACILIGGKSSRMGQPKHLLQDEKGQTWLERTVALIEPFVEGVVISGKGDVPASLAEKIRLPDIPGIQGPVNGILSAGRWQPDVSWLLLACDMPGVTADGVKWLLADRKPGCWGRVPQIPGASFFEPLFAWYDFRAVALFEQQVLNKEFRIGSIARNPKIENPLIPHALKGNWQNVNTPQELSGSMK